MTGLRIRDWRPPGRVWLAQHWPLFLFLGLASWLRFPQSLSNPIFFTDQARAILVARNILAGQWLTWGPQTSVQSISLGPLYYYWTALALWFSQGELWGPVLSVIVASLGTLALLWFWLRRFFGFTAAVVGTGWLAVSGLASLQAQVALEPSPLPLFVMVWLWVTSSILLSRSFSWKLWIVAFLAAICAIQSNASGVIFLAILFTIGWWKYARHRWATFLWKSGMFLIATGIIFKIAVKGSTTVEYWWQMWNQLSSPSSWPVTLFWLLLLTSGACWWLQRGQKNYIFSHEQNRLLWLLGVWGAWAAWAFSLKTISGEHALNAMFIWAAVVLGITFSRLVSVQKGKLKSGVLTLLIIFFTLQAVLTRQWLNHQAQLRVSDHQATVDKIMELSGGEPYALLYQGHLDVYAAADDHFQYLLWRRGAPPVAAARIEFSPAHPEYCEQLLLSHTPLPQKTLVLQVPVTYPQNPAQILVAPPPDVVCSALNFH